MICPDCNGTGAVLADCPECDGTGSIDWHPPHIPCQSGVCPHWESSSCEDCEGEGTVETGCPGCDGAGEVSR